MLSRSSSKKASEAPEEYAKFWDNFGAVLKEGLYEDREQRETLLSLARFRSTARDALISARRLPRVRGDAAGAGVAIYTIAGENLDAVEEKPANRGVSALAGLEVLLLTDPIDEFWTTAVSASTRRSHSNRRPAAASISTKIAPADET